MDPSRPQYPGFWFVCKYCQRVFRDKLELFCHQVNDHPEYRDELNNGQRNSGNSHEAVYADPRATVDSKRQGNNFAAQWSQQHSGSPWYPPSTGHIPAPAENQTPYYSNPVEYYVVVPNQSQGGANSMTGGAGAGNPIMNLPIVNQQLAHTSSMPTTNSCQPQQTMGNNLVTLRNEGGSEWNKVGGDSSDTDTTSSLPNKDDLDYFCWKCKVKFGNAAAYIAHSSSCFPPSSSSNNDSYDQSPSNDMDMTPAERYPHHHQQNNTTTTSGSSSGRKRGRKPKNLQQDYSSYHQEDSLHGDPKRRKPGEEASSSSGRGRRKNSATPMDTNSRSPVASNTTPTFNFAQLDPSRSNGAMTAETNNSVVHKTGDRNFSCTHCGLKFSGNDRLTSHLLQCKSRKNPYESYQYKCIKCSESFDIYLQYKRHIELHTGAVRYS